MLGLPDGDSDPYFDTLPDQHQAADAAQATSSVGSEEGEDSCLQEPPELLAARQRLADFDAGAEPRQGQQQQQPSSGSLEDGAAYLSAVSEAQRELDSAGAAAAVAAAPIRNAAAWPGPDAASDSKLASLRAANQAAMAAIGLSEAPPPSSADGATAAPVTEVAPQAPAAAAAGGDSPCAAHPLDGCRSWTSGGGGSESGGTAAASDGGVSTAPVVQVVGEAAEEVMEEVVVHPPAGSTGAGLFDLE